LKEDFNECTLNQWNKLWCIGSILIWAVWYDIYSGEGKCGSRPKCPKLRTNFEEYFYDWWLLVPISTYSRKSSPNYQELFVIYYFKHEVMCLLL
jgi:hypothetical protein